MSNSVNYAEKVQQLIRELKENKALKVEAGKVNKPLAASIKDSLALRGVMVPGELLEFYGQCDGFHIAWREKKKKGEDISPAAGEINIVSLTETFILHWKDKLWFDWMDSAKASEADKEQFKMARAIKGFDVMSNLLDGTLIIALDIAEGKGGSESDITTYYWDNKGIKFPIALTPSGYIAKSLEYSGMLHWQLFYIDFAKLHLDRQQDQEMFGKLFHTVPQKMKEFVDLFSRVFQEKPLDFLNGQLEATRQFGIKSGLIT